MKAVEIATRIARVLAHPRMMKRHTTHATQMTLAMSACAPGEHQTPGLHARLAHDGATQLIIVPADQLQTIRSGVLDACDACGVPARKGSFEAVFGHLGAPDDVGNEWVKVHEQRDRLLAALEAMLAKHDDREGLSPLWPEESAIARAEINAVKESAAAAKAGGA